MTFCLADNASPLSHKSNRNIIVRDEKLLLSCGLWECMMLLKQHRQKLLPLLEPQKLKGAVLKTPHTSDNGSYI